MAAGVKWKSGGNGKLIAKLKKIGNGGKKTKLTAGFYKGAKYEDGTPVAQVAAWNNFGTIENGGFTPPRPFFNDAIDQNMDKWAENYGKALKKTDYDVERSSKLVGEQMRSDIIDSINDWTEPPNASTTIKEKGRNAPLKDTFFMMGSVAYSYNDEEEKYDEKRRARLAKRKKKSQVEQG